MTTKLNNLAGAGAGARTALLVADPGAPDRLVASLFERAGLRPVRADSPSQAREMLERTAPELVFTQLGLDDRAARAFVERAAAMRPKPAIVVVAMNDQISGAAEAMRAGADICLFWPFSEHRLALTIATAVASVPPVPPVPQLSPDWLKTGSARMVAALDAVDALAGADVPVLLSGPRGSGKALLARRLHDRSARACEAFEAVACETLTAAQVETAFARAAGGTLYLDNVVALLPAARRALRRQIETASAPALPRLLSSADDAPLALAPALRLDPEVFTLSHLASVVVVPGLRDRREDIRAICEAMLIDAARTEGRDVCQIDPVAQAWLEAQNWPGNLPHLRDVIHASVRAEDGAILTPQTVSQAYAGLDETKAEAEAQAVASVAGLVGKSLDEIEEIVIEATIRAEAGSLPRAAAVLGVSPSTLYRKRAAWMKRKGG